MRHATIPAIALLFVLLAASSVSAHVGYVLTPEQLAETSGRGDLFLTSVFTEPLNVVLLLIGVVSLTAILWLADRCQLYKRMASRLPDYVPLFPWMARLSLGIMFIGAGAGGALLNPAFPTSPFVSSTELLVGFLLLAGFLTAPASMVAIFFWLLALSESQYALGSLEVPALALFLLASANSRPGIDDLLRLPFTPALPFLKKHAVTILRFGIGLSMIYLAIVEKFLNPFISKAVVDMYQLTQVIHVSEKMWVLSAGMTELIVGLCLLVGFRTRTFAAIAFVVLTGSFFFFQEEVYAHITLFGVLSILFVTGGGAWSVDQRLSQR